jgi:sarcosine oxidase subunit beta
VAIESSESYDAVVIGAGALGAAIALELARAGLRPLGVDRMSGPGEGSTSDSASIVRVYASTAQMAAMSLDAVHLWQEWGDFLGPLDDELEPARYVRTGSLLLKSPAGHHEQAVPALRELGVRFEEWTPEDMRERLPAFDARSFWPPRPVDDPAFTDEPGATLAGAVYVPEGGYVNDPRLATQNLIAAARASGASFRFHAQVSAVLRGEGRAAGVRLADGLTVRAPVVINVAGPHSAVVNRMAGVEDEMRMSTRPLRHELHVVPAPAGFAPGVQVSDGDLGINFRPEGAEQILVGSEDPPCDPLTWVDDPDDHDRNASRSQWERQVYRLARRLPGLRIPNQVAGLAGLYDVTPDSLPIYDRSALPGFYMAVGTNGNQFKTVPVVGRAMAELILACEGGHDHDAEPLQVRGATIDATFDMGVFSRNRPLPAEARLTVV